MVAVLRDHGRVLGANQDNAEARWAQNLKTYSSNRRDDPGAPELVTFRAPEWNRQILLRVTKCERSDRAPKGEAVIEVDWGPYFDFKKTRAEGPEGAEDVYFGGGNFNLRYRRYVGVQAHEYFNMVVLARGELLADPARGADQDDFSHLALPLAGGKIQLNEDRLWENNQFFFWLSYGRKAVRDYLAPVRKKLSRSGDDVSSALFAVWLHQPLLRRMHLQTQLLAYKEELLKKNALLSPRGPAEGGPTAWSRSRYRAAEEPAYRRDPPALAPGGTLRDFVDLVRRRAEASLWALKHVLPEEAWEYMEVEKGVQEEEEEGAEADAEEAAYPLHVNFPMDRKFIHPWSTKKAFGGQATSGLYGGVAYARRTVPRAGGGGAVDFATTAEGVRGFFEEWRPLNDALAKLMGSDMMTAPQVLTLQSYVGTRVHLRCAFQLVGGGDGGALRVGSEEWPAVGSPAAFFPALSALAPPRGEEFHGGFYRTVAKNSRGASEELRCVEPSLAALLRGEEDGLALGRYVENMRGGDFDFLLRVLNRGLTEESESHAKEVRVVGAEVPVYNPYCLFEKKHGRYAFFQSQMDLLVAVRRGAAADFHLVAVELKSLMEVQSPRDRVRDKRNVSQVVTNAMLFEMQTGLRVHDAVVLFMTRREVGACSYAAHVKLRDGDGARADEALEACFEEVLLGRQFKRAEQGVLHFDGEFLCAHTKGYPKVGPGVGTAVQPKHTRGARLYADAARRADATDYGNLQKNATGRFAHLAFLRGEENFYNLVGFFKEYRDDFFFARTKVAASTDAQVQRELFRKERRGWPEPEQGLDNEVVPRDRRRYEEHNEAAGVPPPPAPVDGGPRGTARAGGYERPAGARRSGRLARRTAADATAAEVLENKAGATVAWLMACPEVQASLRSAARKKQERQMLAALYERVSKIPLLGKLFVHTDGGKKRVYTSPRCHSHLRRPARDAGGSLAEQFRLALLKNLDRCVNEMVFRTFDLQSTPDSDPRCSNGAEKAVVAETFMHEGREGWKVEASAWAAGAPLVRATGILYAVLLDVREHMSSLGDPRHAGGRARSRARGGV